MKVILDTNITPELFAEGIMNEFEHIFATLLKENNIDIKNTDVPRELVKQAVLKTREEFKK